MNKCGDCVFLEKDDGFPYCVTLPLYTERDPDQEACEYFVDGGLTMAENKMSQIAALFGKKLEEKFTAIIWDEMQKCKFTDEGLKVKYLDGDWHKSDNWLRCLLIGEAKITGE